MLVLSLLSPVRSARFPWRSLCCSGCPRSGVTRASSECWTGSRSRGGASCWCWSDRRSVRICLTSSLSQERCPSASPSGGPLSEPSSVGPVPPRFTRDVKVLFVSFRFFRQIVEALRFAHAQGVVHRDIKDENIVVDTRTLEVKIIDFGSGAPLKETPYSEFEGTVCSPTPRWKVLYVNDADEQPLQ